MLTALKTDRLLVSRQDPDTRLYSSVGELRRDGEDYVFVYAKDVTRALPGLPLGKEHRSHDLFPIFAERVMDPRRPDSPQTLEQLGLGPRAGPFEILAVSGGRRTGDTYELTPLPEQGDVELPFLVHGVRHLRSEEQAHVDTLAHGQHVNLQHDPENEANKRAVLVTDRGVRLGYVPDPLLEYVHKIMRRDHAVIVERVNPPEAGFHMRLLVVLAGKYEG